MITRRGFIQGLASLVAAPAVIRVATIMPFKVMPPEEVLVQVQRRNFDISAIREILLPGLQAIEKQYYPNPVHFAELFAEK